MSEREVPEDLLRELGIGPGVTLVQHPVSPFCLAVQRLLEGPGASPCWSRPLWTGVR